MIFGSLKYFSDRLFGEGKERVFSESLWSLNWVSLTCKIMFVYKRCRDTSQHRVFIYNMLVAAQAEEAILY